MAEETPVSNLGICIKMALAQRNMNQSDLARHMDVTSTFVSRIIVNGNCYMSSVDDICQALEIKHSDLFKLGDM